MILDIEIALSKNYKKWCKKYGEEFVDESIANELQMYAENIGEDVLEGYRDVYPELLKKSLK